MDKIIILIFIIEFFKVNCYESVYLSYEKRLIMAFKLNDERPPLDQFLQGESAHAYEFLGSHFVNWDNRDGVVFRVWAPNALSVSIVGDFNNWDSNAN